MHWACAKITASVSTPDAHLLEILLDKVQILVYQSVQAIHIYIYMVERHGLKKGITNVQLNFSSNYVEEYLMLQWPLMLITVAVES